MRGAPLFEVWGGDPIEGRALHECVDLEPERTPHQDLSLRESCPPHRRAVLDLELHELDRLSREHFAPPDRALALEPSARGQGA